MKNSLMTPKFLATILGLFIAGVGYFGFSIFFQTKYEKKMEATAVVSPSVVASSVSAGEVLPAEPEIEEKPRVATHLKTPESVKSVYMTSWAAGTPSFRKRILKIIDETEINSIVIDIKDYTGKISFKVVDPALQEIGSVEKRIPDIYELIDTLHERGVYVIGRIAVFQDPFLVGKRPELAVKKASNKESIWKDKKGISWLDAGSKDVWDYTVAIAKESYNAGFDEINFDYIRFPSDGNMKDIYYPFSDGKVKAEVMKEFFAYLKENLSQEEGIVTSADLFGMTMTNTDDMNIGQVLENTIPYFDFVAPMVYPSHFPPTWNGYKNPATVPYDVIKYSMGKGVERVKAMGEDPLKLRPWLQDFDLGATYTADMVRAQIKATYDVGLNSWMLWDAKNVYTAGALLKDTETVKSN